jgi:hypothetical protein
MSRRVSLVQVTNKNVSTFQGFTAMYIGTDVLQQNIDVKVEHCAAILCLKTTYVQV